MDKWSTFRENLKDHLSFVPFETFDYSINISLQNKYIFVETPKVCCSTIKLNLQRLETLNFGFKWSDPMDVHDRNLSPLLRPSQTLDFEGLTTRFDFFVFCFVRNPYSRLLSCYLDKIVGNKPPKRTVLESLGLSTEDLEYPVTFPEFVDAIASQAIIEMNPHWRPQYYQTFQGSIDYEFVGRYESFSADINYVFDRISTTQLPNLGVEDRHRTNADSLLRQYYNPAILEIVNRIYRLDFEHFNYDSIREC